ncbi:hypothetical protein G5A65_03865 [[Clostridium] scindens]|nr:hypothetical protein [[Clostridium] scindens]NSI88612.1 hypothetical protein [[Clostridium] scindens]
MIKRYGCSLFSRHRKSRDYSNAGRCGKSNEELWSGWKSITICALIDML